LEAHRRVFTEAANFWRISCFIVLHAAALLRCDACAVAAQAQATANQAQASANQAQASANQAQTTANEAALIANKGWALAPPPPRPR
jgi:hypothetical protein